MDPVQPIERPPQLSAHVDNLAPSLVGRQLPLQS